MSNSWRRRLRGKSKGIEKTRKQVQYKYNHIYIYSMIPVCCLLHLFLQCDKPPNLVPSCLALLNPCNLVVAAVPNQQSPSFLHWTFQNCMLCKFWHGLIVKTHDLVYLFLSGLCLPLCTHVFSTCLGSHVSLYTSIHTYLEEFLPQMI